MKKIFKLIVSSSALLFCATSFQTASAAVANSFACLDNPNGAVNTSLKKVYRVGRQKISLNQKDILDMRGSRIRVHKRSEDRIVNGIPVVDSRWGLIQNTSGNYNCFAGGHFYRSNPWQASWEEGYDNTGLGQGYRLGTTRNGVTIDARGERPTVTGIHWLNMHDGLRFQNSSNWKVNHSWGEFTRDDCIENDTIQSGYIYDSLFDGCYTGYSNRAPDSSVDGSSNTVTFNRVMMRLELMAGPHKACLRLSDYFGVDGSSYNQNIHGDCQIPTNIYGTGSLFKLAPIDKNPSFVFKNSIFLIPRDLSRESGSRTTKMDFPHISNVTTCENVTIVYLGSGKYPGYLPSTAEKFKDCFRVFTGQKGKDYWNRKVREWHTRHPDVGPLRKPTEESELVKPRQSIRYF